MKPKDLSDITIIVIPFAIATGFFFLKSHVLVATIFFAVSAVAIVTKIMMTENFSRWLNSERFQKAARTSKALLANQLYLEAALAFQRALTYLETPGIHLGMAYALEKLGNLDLAILEYQSAHFLSYRYSKETLATMTDYYVRALMRRGTDDDAKIALKSCEDSLYHLAKTSNSIVDDLKVSRGFILMRLRRDAEARDQFMEVANTAIKKDVRQSAMQMANAASLIEFAKKGPDWFFSNVEIIEEVLHLKNQKDDLI